MNKELLRQVILKTVAFVAPDALGADSILHFVRNGGFPKLDAATLAAELDYLTRKKLLEEKTAELAAGQKSWALDAPGREYLEGKGLLQ
jgi:hypothetical protein